MHMCMYVYAYVYIRLYAYMLHICIRIIYIYIHMLVISSILRDKMGMVRGVPSCVGTGIPDVDQTSPDLVEDRESREHFHLNTKPGEVQVFPPSHPLSNDASVQRVFDCFLKKCIPCTSMLEGTWKLGVTSAKTDRDPNFVVSTHRFCWPKGTMKLTKQGSIKKKNKKQSPPIQQLALQSPPFAVVKEEVGTCNNSPPVPFCSVPINCPPNKRSRVIPYCRSHPLEVWSRGNALILLIGVRDRTWYVTSGSAWRISRPSERRRGFAELKTWSWKGRPESWHGIWMWLTPF